MDRRDFLKIDGSAVAAGALAARPPVSIDAAAQAAADFNVYDAARLSAVAGLSVQSVGRKSAPVDFPDFTRGRWQTQAPWPIVRM